MTSAVAATTISPRRQQPRRRFRQGGRIGQRQRGGPRPNPIIDSNPVQQNNQYIPPQIPQVSHMIFL